MVVILDWLVTAREASARTAGRRPAVRCSKAPRASEAVGVGRVVTFAHVAVVAAALRPAGLTGASGRIGDERERRGSEHDCGDEDFRGLGKHGYLLRVAMPRRLRGACRYFRWRRVCMLAAITMAWRRRDPCSRAREQRGVACA